VLALAGCSGGGGDATSAGDGSGAGGADAGARSATGEAAAAGGGAKRTTVRDRAVVSKGQLSLHSQDVAGLRADVQRLLDGFDGVLAEEESSSDVDGRTQHSRLVVRVPSGSFDEAMAAFEDLGRLESTSRQSEDVTTEVIDVDARVRAQEKALTRLESLLTRAEDLGDVIRLEDEITERRAALESLLAQQAYLADQTSLATITLYLTSVDGDLPRGDDRNAGFLVGLEGGWNALKTVTLGLATAAGALLPFSVVLLVLGPPTWLVVRGMLRRRTTT